MGEQEETAALQATIHWMGEQEETAALQAAMIDYWLHFVYGKIVTSVFCCLHRRCKFWSFNPITHGQILKQGTTFYHFYIKAVHGIHLDAYSSKASEIDSEIQGYMNVLRFVRKTRTVQFCR